MKHIWREAARLAVACLAFLLVASAATAAGWVVHLKDGTVLQSSRKPVSAFGHVRYWDASKRTVILDYRSVDLEATHAANAGKKVQESAFIVTGVKDKTPQQILSPKKKAVMYSATWCPACKKAKAWLASKGVSYQLIEIDRLPRGKAVDARRAMQRLGSSSFPTFVVDGRAVKGFSPQAYSALLGLKTARR